MLVISRKQNETITIEPVQGIDPDLTLREAFEQGAIEIRLVQVGGRKVRLAIAAPPQMKIWRGTQRTAAGAIADGAAVVNGADRSELQPAGPAGERVVDRDGR